ncbi:UNVERIFIED_CONTAM: Pentatricopeptide repeat-containing protein [Sesamum radiatum]|uniref:Pentatricopeptide repeat-containing protein n=1 Tax=Sesamum radiatum TaxID=300843 RepID=A0AAW2NEJ0_SESRA
MKSAPHLLPFPWGIFRPGVLGSTPRNYSTSPSAVQTLTLNQPISNNPLYNFLPETQNANNLVALVCSSLKLKDGAFWEYLRQQGSFCRFTGDDLSRILLRCQSDSYAALAFFTWVRNNLALKPNAQNFCIMIHILVWSKNYKEAMKILLELVQLKGTGTGNVSERFNVYESLILSTNDCNWDLAVLDMLIKAYLRKGMVKESFQTFRKIVRAGFVPSIVTINCLLNGLSRMDFGGNVGRYCKEGRLKMRYICITSCLEERVEADAVSYNTLIYGYCKEGMMQEARSVLFAMIGRGIAPDNFTCWTLVKGYQNLDRMISALNLVLELTRFGVVISRDMYCYLILALCKENRPFAAKSLLEQMSLNGYIPSEEMYNELIDSLCRGKFVMRH